MNCKPLSVINKSSSLSTKYTTYNLENVEMKILLGIITLFLKI